MNEIPQEAQALAIECTSLAVQYTERQYIIADVAEMESAAEHLKLFKKRMAEIEEARKEITKPMDTAKKRVMDFFAVPLDKLKAAETVIKGAILAYQAEAEKQRREAARQAAEAAQREQERLEAKAAKAEASGKADKADELRAQASMVQPVPVAAEAPKVKGLSTRTVWDAEVTDPLVFLNHCAKHGLVNFVEPNLGALRQYAQATKGAVPIPGVKMSSRDVLAAQKAS